MKTFKKVFLMLIATALASTFFVGCSCNGVKMPPTSSSSEASSETSSTESVENSSSEDSVEASSEETSSTESVENSSSEDSVEASSEEISSSSESVEDSVFEDSSEYSSKESASAQTYVITYSLGAMEGNPDAVISKTTQRIHYSERFTLPTVSCLGYNFLYWTLEGETEEFTETVFNFQEDITLVAVWKLKEDTGWH